MHPFFENVNYPWDSEYGYEFYQSLIEIYDNNKDIDLLYKRCGSYIAVLPPIYINGQDPDELWRNILGKLAKELLIKKLCDIIYDETKSERIKKVISLIRELEPAVHAKYVDLNLVILDRKDLRDYLLKLGKDNDPLKVLLIKGEPKSGKTYSRHLFEKMAHQLGAEVIFLHRHVVVTLEDVLSELFSAALGDNASAEKIKGTIPVGYTTERGWLAAVCRALRDTAKASQKIVWIAVDDLGFNDDGSPIMDSNIKAFFDQFVMHISDLSFRKYFKLMLINYPPGKLPTGWHREHLKEEFLTQDGICQEHVENVIASWCALQKKNILPGDIIKAAVDIIELTDNPPLGLNDLPRLERLNDAVTKLLTTL